MERRRVLTALGAAGAVVVLEPVLAACTSSSGGSAAASTSPSETGSVAQVDPRATAAATESDLVTLAAQIQARWPATATVLRAVQAAHTAHVVALAGTTPSPVTPTDSSTNPLYGGATAGEALRRMASAERAAATQHSAGALTLEPSGARLLASIAAYAAAQDVVLTRASTTSGIGK